MKLSIGQEVTCTINGNQISGIVDGYDNKTREAVVFIQGKSIGVSFSAIKGIDVIESTPALASTKVDVIESTPALASAGTDVADAKKSGGSGEKTTKATKKTDIVEDKAPDVQSTTVEITDATPVIEEGPK